MKYMIMMNAGLGAAMENRTPEWITSMHEFMMKLDVDLKEAGEVVESHGLVDPSQAKTVRFQNGVPVTTDGPFAEVKESHGRVLDCRGERGTGARDRLPGGRLHRAPHGGAAGHGRAAGVVTKSE